MNKQELHDKLAEGPCTISENVFIEIYGNDRKASKRQGYGVNVSRADILAHVHGLSVTKEGANYIFTK
jgi:hypothetical protein